jgi:hypothetical protein
VQGLPCLHGYSKRSLETCPERAPVAGLDLRMVD